MSQIRFSRLLGLGILFLLSALLISCGSGPTEPNPSADSSLAGPPGGLRDLSANAGPAIQIEKATNGFDADSAPGPNIPEGDPVEWTYVVTNTGGADLSRVSVRDNKLALVGCPKIGLAIGASMTCRANGTARAGQYANLATVTATDALGTQVSDEDPSHYFGTGGPLAAIRIEKETNGEDADFGPGPTILVGDKVTWTYVVRNEGTLPLTDVTVTDDQGVLVSCPQDTLAVGETMTCSPATGTAEAAEYMNLGTANATIVGEGGSVSDTDPSHYFGADPQVDIEKATNGVDADIPPGPGICVGGSILWTYEVTNTGNVPLTDVQVSDDNLGSIDCPKSELGPEESMTCTADGTAPAQPGEQYGNKGSVVTWALEGAVKVHDDDLSHYISAENRPPVCSEAFASQETLWPPNHKFVAIEVLGVVDPDGDQVSITIDWIHQDEPVNDVGDGNTSPDGRGVGTDTAGVRAERAGPGNGRVYHIGFTAYDGCDGFCSGEIEVGVPHDKKDVPVDDGATYDSTAP